jgi:TRAP-type C4-dicarboxylate transport system permease small subunit
VEAFDRFNARLVRVLLALAALLIFLLSFLVVADVIGRVAFNSPVKGTPEMVSMSIVIICFLLAGYAVQSGGMLHADILVGLLGWRGPMISLFLSAVLGLIFFGMILWGSWEPTLHAFSTGEYEGEGAMRVPVWPARLVVMAGAALVMVTYVSQGIGALLALLRGKPVEAPQQQQLLS